MKNHPRQLLFQQGLTLVELMVASILGLFVMATVTQVFINSNKTNTLNYQLALMQESARTALSAMAQDARMAGYTGCHKDTNIGNALVANNTADEWATAEQPIQGLNITDTQTHIDSAATSESMLIFQLSRNVKTRLGRHIMSDNRMGVDSWVGALGLNVGNSVAATTKDCSQVALFALSYTRGWVIRYDLGSGGYFQNCVTSFRGSFRCYDSTTPLGTTSFSYGHLSPIRSRVYFIKDDGGLPTLFKKTSGVSGEQSIVDGIEKFHIHYGLDTNNNGVANQFIRAGDRSFRNMDWNQVVVIRIHLLTRSNIEVLPPLPAGAPPRDYWFDGARVTQTDRFLRREYVSTLSLRNKG